MFSVSTVFYKEDELCAFKGTGFEAQPREELCNLGVFPSLSWMDAWG